MSKNTGGPAYPTIYEHLHENGIKTLGTVDGMTLRDYFAGQAMIPALDSFWSVDEDEVAERCYRIADAMIAERDKGE